MGDRISISFKNGEQESVALFSHWRGGDLILQVRDYLNELKEKLENRPKNIYPIDRLEPQTVMVDFIRWLTRDMDIVQNDLYLGKDENDGDNSDNGHIVIDLTSLYKEISKKEDKTYDGRNKTNTAN